MIASNPVFQKVRSVGRVDDCEVLRSIVYVIRNGLQWADAPAEYGPHKTLYNRFRRWSEIRVFEGIYKELAKPDAERQGVLRIDVMHLNVHRTASGLKKRMMNQGLRVPPNFTPYAINRQSLRLHITEGQHSDFKGAGVPLKDLPKAERLLGDKG